MPDNFQYCLRCGRRLIDHDGHNLKCAGIYLTTGNTIDCMFPRMELKNFFPLEAAPAVRRSGLHYVCEIPDDCEGVKTLEIRGKFIFINCENGKKFRVDSHTQEINRADLRRVK